QSSTTPTARKYGATWAISTGPARRRLSCLPKRAHTLQRKAEHPAVYCGKPERDQAEPNEVLRRQRFAEKQPAEEDRDRRHEQGDEQRIGRARRVDQAEIKDVSESAAQHAEGDYRAPGGDRRD